MANVKDNYSADYGDYGSMNGGMGELIRSFMQDNRIDFDELNINGNMTADEIAKEILNTLREHSQPGSSVDEITQAVNDALGFEKMEPIQWVAPTNTDSEW